MEAVEAALAHYQRHKKVIDVQIAVNAAWVAAFYLVHNVARELADRLRGFGHVAHTAHEVGMDRAGDEAHLALATRFGWTLITRNAENLRLLHAAWRQWSRERGVEKHHAGIPILSPPVAPLQVGQEIATLLETEATFRDALWLRRRGTGGRTGSRPVLHGGLRRFPRYDPPAMWRLAALTPPHR